MARVTNDRSLQVQREVVEEAVPSCGGVGCEDTCEEALVRKGPGAYDDQEEAPEQGEAGGRGVLRV